VVTWGDPRSLERPAVGALDVGASRARRLPRWAWLNAAAFVAGLLPVVLACTLHNHGTTADPECVRHCYTLVHFGGVAILAYIGAPALIALVLPVFLYLKSTRRSHVANRTAWTLAVVTCLLGFVGLLTAGLSVLPVVVLTVCAVAAAPLSPGPPPLSGPDPRRDPDRTVSHR